MCYVLKSWANVGQKGCDKRKLRGIARWGKKGLQKGKVGVMRGLVFPLRREALGFNLRGGECRWENAFFRGSDSFLDSRNDPFFKQQSLLSFVTR